MNAGPRTEIRTWTICGSRVATTVDQVLRGDYRLRTVVSLPDLAEGEAVAVIEAKPVLDLLERCMQFGSDTDNASYNRQAETIYAVEALLKAHGRLP